MKKYPVTSFYIGIYIISLLLAVGMEAVLIWGVEENMPVDADLIFMHGICIMEMILSLYFLLFDLGSARFSFNEEGVTMYVGFRKHEFKWEEFTDAGIVGVNVGGAGNQMNTFWVYFSKTYLMNIEKIKFLSKTRRELDRLAYFQCDEELLNQVLEVLPEKLRKTLLWDGECCLVWQNGHRES